MTQPTQAEQETQVSFSDLVAVVRKSPDSFSGQCHGTSRWDRAFGGQLAAQALTAAAATVPSHIPPHGTHSVFLSPGDAGIEIVYDVTHVRDSQRFATRTVTASQRDRVLMTSTTSFHLPEDGPEHQADPPADLSPPMEGQVPLAVCAPLELEYLDITPYESDPAPPMHRVWMRARGLSADSALHAAVLTYSTDLSIGTTGLLPHRTAPTPELFLVASLDHALWFHRVPRADEWLLFVQDSPIARGARSYNRGQLWNARGELCASVTQEGLLRPVEPGSRAPRSISRR